MDDGVDRPRWLSKEEDRAWRGYRRMQLLLNRQIARDLARDAGLSEADYDVLSNVSEAPGGSMRLTELARHMRWSKSRLSHHITRMEQRGLVVRGEVASDARGSVISLTDRGLETIRQAAPGHVESVRRHFVDLLTPAQLAAFAEISWTVVDHLLEAEP
ncbi:MarR family winged helix-turn-helix transcriptional regulator [Thermoactinospora rubra]|uniref:MarR family winged helix-turn-helix transcriptional regulator n=1 Tax=Thermoactinospora rubra TaxID=1088767 RepID=UPI00197D7924|nr:MarR family transcriptional regulator [Thermoactinospora rubra]